MARRRRSRTRTRTFMPRKLRMRSLPAKPGTTIHFVNPDLVVVVEQQGGGAGGAGGDKPAKIRVCKCTKTAFTCHTVDNVTTCREECVQWECREVSGGLVPA
jgi:hypothetical protein